MISFLLWVVAVCWAAFMVYHWGLGGGLALAVGAYAALWFVMGLVQGGRR